MRTVFIQAGARTGYLRLARESGLANNTIASEYIEQLSDLLAVIPLVARDGAPIPGLTADQFEVFIDGRRRPVALAQFVRATDPLTPADQTAAPSARFCVQCELRRDVSP